MVCRTLLVLVDPSKHGETPDFICKILLIFFFEVNGSLLSPFSENSPAETGCFGDRMAAFIFHASGMLCTFILELASRQYLMEKMNVAVIT